jgi:glycosyltransferase involved in cell wall biosynthesis
MTALAKAWHILRGDGALALLRRLGRSMAYRWGRQAGPPLPYTAEQLEKARRGLRSSRRVLLVAHELSLSGAPMMLYVLAGALRERGYDVRVAAPLDGPFRGVFETAGFDLHLAPELLREDGPLSDVGHDRGAVVANTIYAWRIIHAASARLLPSVWWIHEAAVGEEFTARFDVVAESFAVADAVVFPADATAARYRRFARRHNFTTVHYGLDAPVAAAARPPLSETTKLRVALIGSVEPRKGQDVLLKAVEELPPDVAQDIEIYLVGQPLDRGYCAEMAAAGEPLGVKFIGEMPHAQAMAYLRAMDVLVLASRDEVLPVTVLEAMALGKAVVGTRAGGVPEMIIDGKTGFLIEVNDHRALSASIVRLFRDRTLAARMGAAACVRHRKRFGLQRFGDRMTRLIRDTVEDYRPYVLKERKSRT